jgi:hypothetical protein
MGHIAVAPISLDEVLVLGGIEGPPTTNRGRVHRQQRLGGLLNFYKRAA